MGNVSPKEGSGKFSKQPEGKLDPSNISQRKRGKVEHREEKESLLSFSIEREGKRTKLFP